MQRSVGYQMRHLCQDNPQFLSSIFISMRWGRGCISALYALDFFWLLFVVHHLTSRTTLWNLDPYSKNIQNGLTTVLQLRQCLGLRFTYLVGIKCKSFRKYELFGSLPNWWLSVGWMTYIMFSSSFKNYCFYISLITVCWRAKSTAFPYQDPR